MFNEELIEILLKKLGLESIIVSDGEQAIEMYKKEKFDLILMDINMPVMDGIRSAKEIITLKKDSFYNDIPIVALTANSIAGDKEKYLSDGMDDYLSKPIEFDKLIVILKKYLHKDVVESKTINNIEFDKNLIIERLGLDESTVNMLLDNFFLTLDGDLNKLQNSIDIKDSDKILEIAHYIKGACSNFVMNEATDILQEIETKASNQEVDFDLKELISIFDKIKMKFEEK